VINGIEDSCDCLGLKMRDGRNETLGARTRNEKPETRNEKRETKTLPSALRLFRRLAR
jgi:hypothetical protein